MNERNFDAKVYHRINDSLIFEYLCPLDAIDVSKITL